MELVQEVYTGLKSLGIEWPERAVVAIRDADGEIKFSSVGKYDVVETPAGIFMRGEHCLFNNGLAVAPNLLHGTRGRPTVITRSEYEAYFYAVS